MPNICVNCVKESHLKQLVRNEGADDVCSLCGDKSLVINSENQRFFQLTKALVRFHYSEWDYNPHWGGDGYESLFYGENNIFFDESRSLSDESYEEMVLSITDSPVYEEYDEGISIFSGYDAEGSQNMLLQSIKTDLDENLLRISNSLKTNNHFLLEDELKVILDKYSEVATFYMPENERLYRARVGFKDKKRDTSRGFEAEIHYGPYSGVDIGAPPPHLALGGRANRAGVSFLYCATDKYTAISEIRPHPGDQVSLGAFLINREIKIFDLSDSKLLSFFTSDKKLDEYKPFNTLGFLLNKTIPPSERIQYSITQLIADCIRQLQFDGVVFNSTVGTGKNVVLFDQKVVNRVEDGAEIILVNSVEYKYEQGKLVNDDKYYYI